VTNSFENKWVWMDAGEHGYVVCMDDIPNNVSFNKAHFGDYFSYSLSWEFPEPDDNEKDMEMRDLLLVSCAKRHDSIQGPRNWILA